MKFFKYIFVILVVLCVLEIQFTDALIKTGLQTAVNNYVPPRFQGTGIANAVTSTASDLFLQPTMNFEEFVLNLIRFLMDYANTFLYGLIEARVKDLFLYFNWSAAEAA